MVSPDYSERSAGGVKPVPHRALLSIVSRRAGRLPLRHARHQGPRGRLRSRSARRRGACRVDARRRRRARQPRRSRPTSRASAIFELAGTTLDGGAGGGRPRRGRDEAAAGAARLAREAYARGEVSGVLGLGGSAGTTIGTAAMRALPLGVPKVMVSTLASGRCGSTSATKTSSCSTRWSTSPGSTASAGKCCRRRRGRWRHGDAIPGRSRQRDDKPLVAATMFGVTTPCVERARETLERAGYEVLVFHATGNGGQAMESLIATG